MEPELTDDRSLERLHLRLRALVAHLDALQQGFEREHDSCAVFALMYSIMTDELDTHLDHMGLVDPDWIVTLGETFANRYFAAIEAVQAGRSPGLAWQAVFDAIKGHSSVLEDAVFPMTAHIVHDLPLALLDAEFDGPGQREHLHDFDQINRLMQESIDVIRERVTRRYSPGLRFLDRMEGHYDLVLSDYGICMSRGQAWYDALRLRDPVVADAARRSLEERPVVLIDYVRHAPDSSVGVLLAALRWVAALFRRWPAPGPP